MAATLGVGEATVVGRQAAFDAMTGQTADATSDPDTSASAMPGWARTMKAEAAARHHREVAIYPVGQGDRGGSGATPDLHEGDD